MRATRLMDYWKGADGYCRSYVLITKKYTLDDIIYCGKEVVLFGWFPEAAQVVCALKKAGVTVHYVCEVDQVPIGEFENGMPVGDGLVLKKLSRIAKGVGKVFLFLFF